MEVLTINSMSTHQITIHGYKVSCDDDMANWGLKHLAYFLPEDECRALFKQAEDQHEVEFEDNQHRQFTLIKGENYSFVVVATHVRHGWI